MHVMHAHTHGHTHTDMYLYTCTYTQSYSSGVPEGDGLVSRAGTEGVREWQKPHCIHRVCMAPQCHHTLTTSTCAHGDKSLIEMGTSNTSLYALIHTVVALFPGHQPASHCLQCNTCDRNPSEGLEVKLKLTRGCQIGNPPKCIWLQLG